MANTPISGFTSGAPAQAGDEFVIARSGANYKLTTANLATYIGANGAAGTSGQIQYNSSGSFGGMSGTSWDDTNRALTLTGATVTTSQPVLNLSQTWNAGAVTFTGLKFNATDTASAAASKLLDLGTGGGSYVSRFSVDKTGQIIAGVSNNSGVGISFGTDATPYCIGRGQNSILIYPGTTSSKYYFNSSRFLITSDCSIGFASVTDANNASADTILTRANPATLQLGAADAAAPVAQTLQVQGVVAGTSNTAGANFTIRGSDSTGNAAGGSLIFQVAPAGSSGTAQNAYATALTIDSTKGATFTAQVMATRYMFSSLTSGPGISYIGNDLLLLDGSNTTNGGARLLNNSAFVLRSAYYLGWSDAGVESGTYDTRLYRDAANTLALKNSTSPQIFRAYSTTTGPSYGYFASGVTDAGVATADTLFIGTGGAGAAMTKLALVVNGTTRIQANVSGVVTVSGSEIITSSNITYFGADTSGFTFRYNSAANSDLMVRFAGTTSSFPALKRSSASLICRLADDSANAAFEALSLKTGAPTGGTSGTWKVGVYNATAPSATGYVEVDIGGTLYKLLAST